MDDLKNWANNQQDKADNKLKDESFKKVHIEKFKSQFNKEVKGLGFDQTFDSFNESLKQDGFELEFVWHTHPATKLIGSGYVILRCNNGKTKGDWVLEKGVSVTSVETEISYRQWYKYEEVGLKGWLLEIYECVSKTKEI